MSRLFCGSKHIIRSCPICYSRLFHAQKTDFFSICPIYFVCPVMFYGHQFGVPVLQRKTHCLNYVTFEVLDPCMAPLYATFALWIMLTVCNQQK